MSIQNQHTESKLANGGQCQGSKFDFWPLGMCMFFPPREKENKKKEHTGEKLRTRKWTQSNTIESKKNHNHEKQNAMLFFFKDS